MKTLSFRKVMIRLIFTFPLKIVTEACFSQCVLNERFNEWTNENICIGKVSLCGCGGEKGMDMDSGWFKKQQSDSPNKV